MTRVDGGKKAHGRFRLPLFLAPLLLLWLLPVSVFAATTSLTAKSERAAVAFKLPSTTEVGTREQDLQTQVLIEVAVRPGPDVTSPVDGVITKFDARIGQKFQTGMKIVEVDGTPVYVVVGGSPLFRTIARKDTGDDVSTMCKLLHALKFYGPLACTTADTGVVHAVKAFQESIGTSRTGSFAPSYVAYVPEPGLRVASLNANVGQRVTSGVALLKSSLTAESIAIKADNGSGAASPGPGPLAGLAGQALTLRLGAEKLPLPSINVPPRAVSRLAQLLEEQSASGMITSQQETGAGANEAGDGPKALTYSGGLLSLRDPETVGVVPGSAIYLAPSGRQCLFVASTNRQALPEAKPIQKASSLFGEPGLVAVDRDLAGETVVSDITVLPSERLDRCA